MRKQKKATKGTADNYGKGAEKHGSILNVFGFPRPKRSKYEAVDGLRDSVINKDDGNDKYGPNYGTFEP